MFIPLILIILVVAVFISYKMMVRPPSVGQGILQEDGTTAEPTRVQGSGRKQDVYTFLLCGTDDGNGGTDTIMVAAYDVKNQKMNVMSIPRDTMVNVSWSTKKINSSYNAGGISRLAQEAGNLIGFPLDFYIKVDLKGFVQLIDALGGVEFEVPYNMNYDDPAQNLSIHVKKGMQHLNGADAVGVVRWRKNNDGTGYSSGDIGRIQTQQAFLKAVGKKCLNFGNITKVKEFAEIFSMGVSSAMLRSISGKKKMGSYPNPPSPRGASPTTPSQMPSAVSTLPSGKQQAMAQTKRHARFASPSIFRSSRRYRSTSSRSSPPYRAE
jgi:LCP family protein required for cell wall assembly